MMMKINLCKAFVVAICIIPSYILQAQYLGGDGDGYSVAHLNSLIDGTELNLYAGGNGDGYVAGDREVTLIATCVLQSMLALDDDPIEQEVYAARRITSAGKIRNPDYVEMIADRSITLEANFEVEKKATFYAYTSGCISQPVNF